MDDMPEVIYVAYSDGEENDPDSWDLSTKQMDTRDFFFADQDIRFDKYHHDSVVKAKDAEIKRLRGVLQDKNK